MRCFWLLFWVKTCICTACVLGVTCKYGVAVDGCCKQRVAIGSSSQTGGDDVVDDGDKVGVMTGQEG